MDVFEAILASDPDPDAIKKAAWRIRVNEPLADKPEGRLLGVVREAERSPARFEALITKALPKDFELDQEQCEAFDRRWFALRRPALVVEAEEPRRDRAAGLVGGTLRLTIEEVLRLGTDCLRKPRPVAKPLEELRKQLSSLDLLARERGQDRMTAGDLDRIAELAGRCSDAVGYVLLVLALTKRHEDVPPSLGAAHEADRTAAELMRTRELNYAHTMFRERFGDLTAQLHEVDTVGATSIEES